MFSEPSLLRRSAMSAERTCTGSGTGPPHIPLCSGWSRTLTSTSTWQMPRSWYVSAGTPVSKLAVSERTM